MSSFPAPWAQHADIYARNAVEGLFGTASGSRTGNKELKNLLVFVK